MDWGWGFTSCPSGAMCLDGKEGQFDWHRTYGAGDVKTNRDQLIGVAVPKSMGGSGNQQESYPCP